MKEKRLQQLAAALVEEEAAMEGAGGKRKGATKKVGEEGAMPTRAALGDLRCGVCLCLDDECERVSTHVTGCRLGVLCASKCVCI